MSRMVLSRSLAVLTLVLGLGLLSPAWAAGKPSPPPAPPAPAAALHAGAVAALRSWLQSVLAKLVPGSGGKPAGVDAGASDDPNG